ncbi:curli assembly protein CsgF [Flavobacterium amniphilum]|uniref:curli assembly protein CsgF n=1 Tax=Flavobacterium amniphilum TaxID=1834035 RepID=UPI00202A7D8C|nr:curli assembly protein CsgF [Flavobacterium amniphilum]MCL9807611.1 curli assembly protein CsgF [Flavobacterium amniphilum]
MKNLTYIVFLLFFSNTALSQDLVYKPKNPALGGDTFNYQWMLSSADSQNKYKEEEDDRFQEQSQLERFTENLNNQLLNQLARSLFQQQFGTGSGVGGTGGGTGTGTDGGIQPGIYTFGTLSIEIFNSNLGLVVDILDITTGEQTQVIIP